MIAVDSTVLADWLFNDEALRESVLRLQAMDGDWVCLALARYELGNVGWKLARAGRIAAQDLAIAWTALDVAEIKFVDESEWPEVSVLAASKEISFYDAAHVWLAKSKGIPLFSRDGKLRAKCSEVVHGLS